MSNQQYDKKHLATNTFAAGNLTTQRFSHVDNRVKATQRYHGFDETPIQRVIKIGSEEKGYVEYKEGKDLPTLLQEIVKECNDLKKNDIMIQQGNLIKLVLNGEHKFVNYRALYNHVAPAIVPKVSKYEELKPPPKSVGDHPMVLFRAMSAGEAAKLDAPNKFGMYINKHNQESGIKFFATDINYSIKLSNTKNEEAHNKREAEMPYTRMFAAVVNKEELIHGLKEDIGVHDDDKHTSKFISAERMSGALDGHGKTEDQFRDIVKRQGEEPDREDHGYVLKHENGGLNFGVKAKTAANTKPHWRSPIEYFNSLVKDGGFIGEFKMVPPEEK